MLEIFNQARAVGFDFLIVISGLGLFLFGINSLGEELKNIAGSKMKSIIDRFTTNPIKGIFVGIVVTALMQSSSATTVLVISLIRSGLMTLSQAIGIFMGANIGTTVTAIMIGFNISKIAPYGIVIGAFIELFAKSNKTRNYARLLIAFGTLFLGIELMGNGLEVLADMPIFYDFATALSVNKYYAVLFGIVLTTLIQSSSASIGILQTLYGQGILSLSASLPFIFGANIGTTITAVLSSVGGSKEAKKATLSYIIFNVIGTVLFMILLPYFTLLVESVTAMLGLNKLMELALAHFMFNLTTTIILFPLIKQLVKLINMIIKGVDEEKFVVDTVFDKSLISESPALALDVALNGTLEMAQHCNDIFKLTRNYIEVGAEISYDESLRHEEVVNALDQKLSAYLVDISGHSLDENSTVYLNLLMYSIKDLERIGDHLININNHFQLIYEQGEQISEDGKQELATLMNIIDKLLSDLSLAIKEPSIHLVDQIFVMEDEINKYEEQARKAFINRLKAKIPMGALVMALYVDILSDFERVGDYAHNIAGRLRDTVIS